MATLYESIVRVRCDSGTGASRDDVLDGLRSALIPGQFLIRAEEEADELTVTAQLTADDASLAQRQAEHVVSEALVRSGQQAGTRIEDTEIRSGG
jgi:hypothetical protein